jgi:hypothetical protein
MLNPTKSAVLLTSAGIGSLRIEDTVLLAFISSGSRRRSDNVFPLRETPSRKDLE